MRFEWKTLKTRPGVCLSVDGQNRLHTSLGIPLIYRNQEDTPHGIVSVATAIRVPTESQWRRKAEAAGMGVPSHTGQRHERPADGKNDASVGLGQWVVGIEHRDLSKCTKDRAST